MRAKAKLFVPCRRLGNNRCPGTMQLVTRRDGVWVEREYYRCDNEECRFHLHENGVFADRVNWPAFVRADNDTKKRKTGDPAPTAQEMETMI